LKSVKYFVILSIFGLILAALIWRSGSVDPFGFSNVRQFFYGFFRVIFSFFAGVAIFRFSISLGSIRIPAWLTVLSLGCLLLEPFINKSWAYDVFCIGFAFPLIIMFGAALEIRGLSAKIMSILGKVSYPFYIIHQPILRVIHGLMFKFGYVVVPATAGALIALVVAAGTSYGLLLIYDEPTRSFLTRAALQKSLIKRSSKLPV
jgi:peptidoglycan/LPS O-acetylase OafA/YrhL